MKQVSWQKSLIASLIGFLLVSCAANSGVAPIGPATFIVSRQAATGFSGSGTLKADALNEANQYCAARSKVIYVVTATEAAPPYVMGNFPKAEVQFMCLDANDPRLRESPPRRFTTTVQNQPIDPAVLGALLAVNRPMPLAMPAPIAPAQPTYMPPPSPAFVPPATQPLPLPNYAPGPAPIRCTSMLIGMNVATRCN